MQMQMIDTSMDTERRSPNQFTCLSTLQMLPGIFLRQKFNLLETLTGFQTPNNFLIFAGDQEGKTQSQFPLMIAKEHSEWCQRICLPADCREFQMNIRMNIQSQDQIVMRFQRDYKCTCLCFQRPFMDVEVVQGNQVEKIGRIFSPFMCCDRGVHIFGRNNELKYKAIAQCCQTGIVCGGCPCEPCQFVDFVLTDASGNKVGDIFKVTAGCVNACFASDSTDCFRIPFPEGTTPEDKALLLASIIFIDFRFFEINRKDNL